MQREQQDSNNFKNIIVSLVKDLAISPNIVINKTKMIIHLET